jgi:hypothetical protein
MPGTTVVGEEGSRRRSWLLVWLRFRGVHCARRDRGEGDLDLIRERGDRDVRLNPQGDAERRAGEAVLLGSSYVRQPLGRGELAPCLSHQRVGLPQPQPQR